MTEEERAALWRQEQINRAQAARERRAALAGSSAARDELAAKWQPVTSMLDTHRQGARGRLIHRRQGAR